MFAKLNLKIILAALVLLIVFVLAVTGCCGRKVVVTKPVDLSIPPDLAKTFEVKEFSADQAAVKSVSLVSNPQTASKKKKARKAKDDKVEAQDIVPQIDKNGVPIIKAGTPDSILTLNTAVPNRRPKIDPIWIGEKIWMDATWLSMAKAGELVLEVLPYKEINGRKVYDFKGAAKTSDLISLVYKAEDWIESFVDYEGLFPYRFIMHGDETKHIRNTLELFDHGAKKQYVHIHDNRIQQGEIHEEKGYKDLTPFSQDTISSIYYARTLDYPDGAVVRFPTTTGGSQFETQLTVVAREELSTPMGKMRAIKTKVETRLRGVLQQQGDAYIWLSDDDRKFLLRFEAKVKIGWIAGITKQIEKGQVPPPPVVVVEEKKQPERIDSKGRKRRWFKDLIQQTNNAQATGQPSEKK